MKGQSNSKHLLIIENSKTGHENSKLDEFKELLVKNDFNIKVRYLEPSLSTIQWTN